MKYARILAVLLLSVGFLASCKKDEPTQTQKPTVHGNFYAKVNNKDWDATQSAAAEQSGRLKITATPIDGTLMEFDLQSGAVGTYPVDSFSQSVVKFYTDSAEYSTRVDSSFKGEVIITKNEGGKVSGSFHFVMANTITGKQLTIEEGVFTDVSFGTLLVPFRGDTLYMAWMNMTSKQGLYYVLQNRTSGELAFRKILGSTAYKGGVNSCKSDKGRYLGFPVKGVGGYFNIPDHSQLSLFVTDSFYSPVVIHDRYYYQRPLYGIYELDPLAGASTLVRKSFSYKSQVMTTDGTDIFSTDGDSLYQVAVASGTTIQYLMDDPGNYLGLEHYNDLSFYAVIGSQIGGKLVYQLVSLEINGTKVFKTVICDIKQDNASIKKTSFAFDRQTNTYYAAFPLTGTTFCKVSEINVITGDVKTHVIEGDVSGFESIH